MKKYFPRYPKPGDVVMVRFHDHVEDHDESLECIVYGMITKMNKRDMIIECWTCTDPTVNKDNSKTYCIVRSTIVRCDILKGKK